MEKELGIICKGIIEHRDQILSEMTNESGLELSWFFKYDISKSEEWNTYHFYSMLKLYESRCRRWEELHNGTFCVVERVRDKYLIPKITEFLKELQNASQT